MKNLSIVKLFPIWKGQTAVVIGNGPSLTPEDVLCVRVHRTIAINKAWELAGFADILYGCDPKWWHSAGGAPGFCGYKLQHIHKERAEDIEKGVYREHTGQSTVLPFSGIDCVMSNGSDGFEYDPRYIRHGGNSGYQAVHIAMHLGAKKIILLGFDMGYDLDSHWFGAYPGRQHTDKGFFGEWIPKFDALKIAADNLGIDIVNCSRKTNLHCFRKSDLKNEIQA